MSGFIILSVILGVFSGGSALVAVAGLIHGGLKRAQYQC